MITPYFKTIYRLATVLYCLCSVWVAVPTRAQSSGQASTAGKPATEEDFYRIVTLPMPEGVALEVGGLALLPNGTLAASTRRGEVWLIENPYGQNPYYKRFAHGLHEILGLAYKDGALYMSQRGELTKLTDKNKDGIADSYETIYAWPLSGHYHEYSYGPVIHSDGTMTVTSNVAFGDVEWWKGESRVMWRGWTMQITPDGKMTPYATGMRSPNGIGLNKEGDLFYAENQGDWMGSGGITHLEKGDFVGHIAGLRWSDRPESPVKIKAEDVLAKVAYPQVKFGVKPEDVESDKIQPLFELEKDLPAIKTPAVWFPHTLMGISTSDILLNTTKGAFGPFDDQLFVGDQGHSKINRVFLEKVKGVYQGAVFPFREGFVSGVMRITWGKDGSMFVGQSNRGWGSTGKEAYGLQRLEWTGKMPFEMKTVRAQPDGFEIEFTAPADKKTAQNPAAYAITSFTYKYHPVYGSPVIRDKTHKILGVRLSEDGMKARLVVEGPREGYIHQIQAADIRSQENKPLLHETAYYTLNRIPDGDKLALSETNTKADHSMHGDMSASTTKNGASSAQGTASKGSNKSTASKAGEQTKRQTKMPVAWKAPDQTLAIGTQPGLKFDVEKVSVKPGAKIKLTFNNDDDMTHNLVITTPGDAVEVGNMAIKLGLDGSKMSYIPKTDKVLYHTKLLQPGSEETIYFTAPEKPGDYTIVCTYPGHAYVMQATFQVVAN
jgi:azurin/glucose/arabinose dehydrogenase